MRSVISSSNVSGNTGVTDALSTHGFDSKRLQIPDESTRSSVLFSGTAAKLETSSAVRCSQPLTVTFVMPNRPEKYSTAYTATSTANTPSATRTRCM